MERSAIVEVFARDETTFYLAVEPSTAVNGLRQHLKSQDHDVQLVDPTVGDIGVSLINGGSLEAVLGAQVHITNRY